MTLTVGASGRATFSPPPQLSQKPSMGELCFTPLSDTQWRVSDRRIPLDDGRCVRGFIEKIGDEFEVLQLGGEQGFSWFRFSSFADAQTHFSAREHITYERKHPLEPTETLVKLSETEETVADQDSDIRGRELTDRDGNALGKIKDLLVDQTEHKVRFLEVASGGFLGIGQDMSLIPVDAITSITKEEVRIDQTLDRVAGAPVYDPEMVHERDDFDPFYGYYGYGPFWASGYVYPNYPHYGGNSTRPGGNIL